MPVDPGILGPATLAISSGVSAFQSFLPKLSEIRKASPSDDPSFAADVRMGEVAAVAVTVGVGAVASSLTGSPTPAVVAVVIAVGLVVMYESTLNADRPMEPKGLTS
jgi:hypothetical protein